MGMDLGFDRWHVSVNLEACAASEVNRQTRFIGNGAEFF